MEQTHRIYRAGQAERDETLIVDGFHLKAPTVRIIANRSNRYEIERVAPQPAAYAFTFTGAVNESDAYGYVFQTQSRGSSSYAITEVEIDGRTFLPRTVHFHIAGGGVHGSGVLTYGQVDKYWLVLTADVSAHLSNGSIAHEIVRWSKYSFPRDLPPSTFDSPHVAPAPIPAATTPPPATPPDAPVVP